MANTPRRHDGDRPLDDAGIDAAAPSAASEYDRPREPKTPVRPAAEETLDEVHTYLQELFGRYGLSQSKSVAPPVTAPRQEEPKPRAAEAAPESTGPPEVQTLRCLPDPKRPPERRDDILALRELSTRSARGAIAQFDTGRIVAATWARFWLCFAALGLTLFFLQVVEPFTTRTLCAAAVGLVLSVYWCGQFWMLTRQAARIGTKPSRRHSEAPVT